VTPPIAVVITGGQGMLAGDLAEIYRSKLPGQVLAPSRTELDITSEASLRALFSSHRPKLLLNAAAYTSVDGAEAQKELATRVNALGPALLNELCQEFGCRLVHFSTDQVFDGTAGTPYTETDHPNASNAYAESKLRGEKAVLASPENLVLRVQWLYGERKDRFSPLRQKSEFSPFSDQRGSPTWTLKLAEVVLALTERGSAGLFHFSYDDYGSWEEVFQFVCDEWKLKTLLTPKKTSDLKLPANRPLFSVLSNKKLVKELGLTGLGSWKAPLREFLKKRAQNG
jgi:dTDP-4-dehydrorhamnose reductase